eukprot:647347-Rhodomonas_salina.1
MESSSVVDWQIGKQSLFCCDQVGPLYIAVLTYLWSPVKRINSLFGLLPSPVMPQISFVCESMMLSLLKQSRGGGRTAFRVVGRRCVLAFCVGAQGDNVGWGRRVNRHCRLQKVSR